MERRTGGACADFVARLSSFSRGDTGGVIILLPIALHHYLRVFLRWLHHLRAPAVFSPFAGIYRFLTGPLCVYQSLLPFVKRPQQPQHLFLAASRRAGRVFYLWTMTKQSAIVIVFLSFFDF